MNGDHGSVPDGDVGSKEWAMRRWLDSLDHEQREADRRWEALRALAPAFVYEEEYQHGAGWNSEQRKRKRLNTHELGLAADDLLRAADNRPQREVAQDVQASASEAIRSSMQAGGATRAFRTSSGEIGYVSVSGGKP